MIRYDMGQNCLAVMRLTSREEVDDSDFDQIIAPLDILVISDSPGTCKSYT
jgi:hypothetical protein